MTTAQGNGVYGHPGYNPQQGVEAGARGVPHLKQHEQEYFKMQNYYQTEVPLFAGGLGAGDPQSNINEEMIMQSVHSQDDSSFTQAIKNVSNNLAIQYAQPSPNEKIP